MRKKVRSQPGFTLIEVLVVVAIIVILLAIAIPAVMGALDNARHNADAKYERAAMALVNARWTTGAANADDSNQGDVVIYTYDPEKGVVGTSRGTNVYKVPAFGQCREHGHQGKGIYVRLNKDNGEVLMCWAEPNLTGISGTNSGSFKWNQDLCSDE